MSRILPAMDEEHRRADRKALFVAATLIVDGASCPIRIRNISTTGAMAEGQVLPPAGSPMRLARGSLSVDGRVAWCSGSQCGLAFDHFVDVAAWTARPGNVQQARIDQIVADHRAGESIPASAPSPVTSMAEEIRAVQRIITQLGEALSGDPDIIARHMQVLQSIDRAEQMLGKLAHREADKRG